MDLSLVPIWLLFVITVIFSVLGETYKAHYIKNKMVQPILFF